MTATPNPGPAAGESIEALRRLKAAENELDERRSTAESTGAERLRILRADAEQAFRVAKAETERATTAAIETARKGLESEVAALVQAGSAEAARVASGSQVVVAALKPKLIDAVVGSFRSD